MAVSAKKNSWINTNWFSCIILTITAHAASLRKELKQKSSEQFEDTTLGGDAEAGLFGRWCHNRGGW